MDNHKPLRTPRCTSEEKTLVWLSHQAEEFKKTLEEAEKMPGTHHPLDLESTEAIEEGKAADGVWWSCLSNWWACFAIMGNLQSTTTPQQSSAAMPSPRIRHEDITVAKSSLELFSIFLQLPLELQASIWSHALETSYIAPRIVRVTHEPLKNTFKWSFKTPPLMEVCRLSRKIAQNIYVSLLPDSMYPIYFHPEVDFLHCTSTPTPFNGPDPVSSLTALSCFNETSNLATIRYLVLDMRFWSHRTGPSDPSWSLGACPIPELRLFNNIEELYLVVNTPEEYKKRLKRIYHFFPFRPGTDPAIYDVERRYALAVARHEAAPDSIVPGYRIYREGFDSFHDSELKRCFGIPQQPTNPNFAMATIPPTPVERRYWKQIPKLTEIRAVTAKKVDRAVPVAKT
ncbi:hypothetical protein BDZ45DRAFT_687655 [Acephala macrosclerotiorum]|nr:hypothetical protein BDZ45DRAFT_687655 [Acephala macrosclerotiorum]